MELSPREQELILAVARGHTSRQIAALQQLRSDTVRRRLSQLYRRVGVRNQRALVAWGLARGLIRQPDLAAAVPAPDDAPGPAGDAAGSRRRWAAADR
ncbi:MAG: response regulator transcription factor [Synechococcus sp.]